MANDRQISQLVLQVDAQVAVAQRSLQDLARTVQQSSTQANAALGTTDASIGRTLSAHHSLGLAYNNARIAQTELTAAVTRSVDAYGAGASPLRILTTEMGRLTEAASFLGGGAGNGIMGSMLRFLGGPWGIGILVGASLLTKLVSAHGDAKDAAAKHRDAEETLIAYIKGEDVANGALLDSLSQLNKERSKALDFTDEAIRKEIDLTNAVLDHARANKALLETQLATAKGELTKAESAQQAAFGGGKGAIEAASGELDRKQAEVDSLQSSVADVDKVIGQASAVISNDIVKLARDLKTHVGQANDEFDSLQTALENKYRGTPAYQLNSNGSITTTLHGGLLNQPGTSQDRRQQLLGELEQAESKLNVAREKAVAAARELDDAEKGKTETEKQATDNFKHAVVGAEGTGPNRLGSSAAGFGQFMPSTWLSYFNRLFPSQTQLSDATKLGFRNVSEVANAVIDKATDDYVKVLKTAGQQITEANLYTVHLLGAGDAKKLLTAAASTPTSEILSRSVLAGNPFLKGTAGDARSAIGRRIGDSSGAVSTAAGAIDKQLADASKQQVDQLEAFLKQSAQLDAETLASRKQLLTGYDTDANLQSDEIEAQRQAQRAAIAKQLTDKGITKGAAIILDAQVDDLAAAKQAVVAHKEYLDSLNQLAAMAKRQVDAQVDDLKFADEMARTQAEHRKLQLDILDIQYKAKQAQIDNLLLLNKINQDLLAQQGKPPSADLQKQAADLQAQKDRLSVDLAHQQTLVNRNTMDPLQAWAYQVPKTAAEINEALQSIEVQGIDNLADAISGVITGTESLGKAFKSIADGIISDIIRMSVKMLIFQAISGIFGDRIGSPNLGALQPVGINLSNTALTPSIAFRASGGPVSAGQAYIVGENRPELFVPSTSGTILPSIPKISIPQAANDRGDTINVFQSFNNNFAGGSATQDDVNRMGLIARTSAVQAIREERRRAAR